MFDAHHHHFHAVTEQVTKHIEVTEKRAPTDESVRLLREMQDAAQKAIVAAVRVDNCVIDAVLHRRDDWMNDATLYRCIYCLNGTKRTVDYEHITRPGDDRGAAVRGMVDALAKDLATVIVGALDVSMRKLMLP